MSCRGCTKKYGIFLKELGCPKCKFAFCKNCLKYSIDGSPEKKKLKVCLSCFSTSQKSPQNSTDTERPVPDAYIKRIEKLSNESSKNLPVVTPASGSVDKDDEIRNRLEKLREDRQPKDIPTEDEMRRRLANLRGQEYKEYSNAHVFAADTRSDQQKLDDLMKQFAEESAIREAHDPAKDVEKRLAALKENPLVPSAKPTNPVASPEEESEDEETAAKKITQRYLAEVSIEGDILDPDEKELISSLPAPSKDTEELPWCTVCNEDATIRCLGCDGELFCRECFKDIHDDEEYRAHRTKAYGKKKTPKDSSDED
uniref:Putative membrane trafficking and cell signaling protein hrs n=1 Tax=Nyssomyia neivai TaxID=330878 RepID=A0A1L8DWA1_9DIPT